MLILLGIFSVCALGIALVLGAVLIGRLTHTLFLEVRQARFALEKLVIEERRKVTLLENIAARLPAPAREPGPETPPDTQNAPLE